LDSDWEDRSVIPVFVSNDNSAFNNKLNSMMDHVWDGFYTGQLHKSMFPSLIETDQSYTIEYTGTPFNNMEYTLRAKQGKVNLRILYWNSGSYEVYVGGNKVEPNGCDKSIGKHAALTTSK
jgi:hypothetical protein